MQANAESPFSSIHMQLIVTGRIFKKKEKVTRFLIEVSLKLGRLIIKPNIPKKQPGTWIVDMSFPIPYSSAQNSIQVSAALWNKIYSAGRGH